MFYQILSAPIPLCTCLYDVNAASAAFSSVCSLKVVESYPTERRTLTLQALLLEGCSSNTVIHAQICQLSSSAPSTASLLHCARHALEGTPHRLRSTPSCAFCATYTSWRRANAWRSRDSLCVRLRSVKTLRWQPGPSFLLLACKICWLGRAFATQTRFFHLATGSANLRGLP